MPDIRIKDLPSGVPNVNKRVAMDLTTAESATIKDIVYAGRPSASQAEAQSGTNSEKAMTPLTTKQSIASEVGETLASSSQGALADTALQPGEAATVAQGELADTAIQPQDLPYVTIEKLGGYSLTQSQLVAINGGPDADAAALANSDAIDAAFAFLVSQGGGTVVFKTNIYVFGRGFVLPANVRVIGTNPPRFQPKSVADKKWVNGTVFLFKGAPAKTITFPGITSMEHGGGWRPDPDNPGQFIKLWSAYNADATGTQAATLRQFSAAVLEDNRDGFGGLEGMRIAVWKGTDGISDYSNASAGLWGDDYDFGHLIINTEEGYYRKVQVIGPWREAGHALMLTIASANRAERVMFDEYWSQGRIGQLARTPDAWAVTGLAVNTISIRWSSELYFSPSGGSFRGSNNVTYTYTGVSHVGSDATYTFTGVTPDPVASGISYIRHVSSGLANTEYDRSIFFGLDHPSGNKAEFYGTTSKAGEISGEPLRGLKFSNSKHHTSEKTIIHRHMCSDFTTFGHQYEGGGHVIASPDTTLQLAWAEAPVRETRDILEYGSTGLSDAADIRLLTPRSGIITEIQFNPRSDLTGDASLRPILAGRNTYMQPGVGGLVQWRNSAGTSYLQMTDAGALSLLAGAQFTLAGGVGRINFQTGQQFTLREGTTVALQVDPTTRNIRPGADNSQTFGSTANRWSNGYFTQVRPGAGAVIWTSNTGSPEGVLTAPQGSLYTRTDGGALTTLYVKETGVGNTGWVAK